MKNLTLILIGLCFICLFSFQAIAEDSGVRIPHKQRYFPTPPQVQSQYIGSNQNYPNNQQTVTSAPQVNQDPQNLQSWGNSTTQELKQFSQQTQQELSQ